VPGVFIVGDAASVVFDGSPVPAVAQAAIQQGRCIRTPDRATAQET
jgi:NADH:ubiquinone reductase (H+-translocating)